MLLSRCVYWDAQVTSWSDDVGYAHEKLAKSSSTMQNSFRIVWVENRRPYRPANLDEKSVEDCLRFLSADRVRRRHFPGTPTSRPVSDVPLELVKSPGCYGLQVFFLVCFSIIFSLLYCLISTRRVMFSKIQWTDTQI